MLCSADTRPASSSNGRNLTCSWKRRAISDPSRRREERLRKSSPATWFRLPAWSRWSEISAASLTHYDQLRSATLQAGLAPGVTLGDGLTQVLADLRPMLPASTRTAFAGQSYEFFQAQSGVALVFGLAIVVIFLVLAAQFESFRDPVIILVTVPLAIVGALVTLIAVGSAITSTV